MDNIGAFDLSKLTVVSFAAMRLEIGTWQVQPQTACCVVQLLLYIPCTWQVQPQTACCVVQLLLYIPCTKYSASQQQSAHVLLVCSSLQRPRRLSLPLAATPSVS